jgi:hypothetical protein
MRRDHLTWHETVMLGTAAVAALVVFLVVRDFVAAAVVFVVVFNAGRLLSTWRRRHPPERSRTEIDDLNAVRRHKH